MTDCLFCKIVKGEIPATVLYEDEEFFAFKDINPRAKVHVLIIPKKHYADLASVPAAEMDMIGRLHSVACRLAEELGIAESGFRLVTNCRADSGQEVAHLHYHLLGGEKLAVFA